MTSDQVPVSYSLVQALKEQYPLLSSKDIAQLVEKLTDEIGRSFMLGERIAFVTTKQNGDVELRVWNIEPFGKE